MALLSTAVVLGAAVLAVPAAAAARGGHGEPDHEEDQQNDGVRGPERQQGFPHQAQTHFSSKTSANTFNTSL